MKKFLLLLLLFPIFFIGCSSSDNEIVLNREAIIGTWYISDMQKDGTWYDMSDSGMRIYIGNDGIYRVGIGKYLDVTYYEGKYTINGNTIIGITSDPITERFTFTKLEGNYAEVSYSNSDGLSYNFKATKK